jgi:ATP-dependent DNA helicase DinG
VSAAELIEQAFLRLSSRQQFDSRRDQVQLSLLLSDLIEHQSTGVFEAPTGLGKSLAILVASLANAIANDKRTVVATYTNVLADQYWQKDLPIALSLFDEHVETAILMGRQRYVCLLGLDEAMPDEVDDFRRKAQQGTESEFRQLIRKPDRDLNKFWSRVQVPAVCPARACPLYEDCYYYEARRKLEKAKVVITNHSVTISDALSADPDSGREGLLFNYDFLMIDEAHDFPSAALNGLEFELSIPKLNGLVGISQRLESLVEPLAHSMGEGIEWKQSVELLRKSAAVAADDLAALSQRVEKGGIVAVFPVEVDEHPAVQQVSSKQYAEEVNRISSIVREACDRFYIAASDRIERYRNESRSPMAKQVSEASRNYLSFVRDFATGAHELSSPSRSSVSFINNYRENVVLRNDLIDLAQPLNNLFWERRPSAAISATLLIDSEFDHFERVTGINPVFREVLPSPFDFSTQAALYIPKPGQIPDPTQCREGEMEQMYYMAIAKELSQIIEISEGRTLALFHSRKEMEGVRQHIRTSDDFPILMQGKTGVATVGEQFKKNIYASLFALRSFWTGFDAPGETCSCVALVRIPFEVPTEPSQIARMAYLSINGMDPFANHTLPNAKMIMRQGAGRLIRSLSDKGVIAILDPRIRTKRYGEQIIANFPAEMRTFDDFADAAGWIGIGGL